MLRVTMLARQRWEPENHRSPNQEKNPIYYRRRHSRKLSAAAFASLAKMLQQHVSSISYLDTINVMRTLLPYCHSSISKRSYHIWYIRSGGAVDGMCGRGHIA